MPAHSIVPLIIAYSYIRFSHPSQAGGDSLRRQLERTEEYCLRRGWKLDTSLTLRDLGVSAFRGKNALVGALGVFLKAIERGTVKPGSVFIVENLDRISRQGIDEGYDLVKKILKAGVTIVTLAPEREFDVSATKSLSKGALEIQLILERAAEESERKSERVGAAWSAKKKKAQEGIVMTRRLPAWLEKDQAGKLALVPGAVAAVRRVFDLAATGHGIPAIIKRLETEKVAPIGRSGRWTRAYLNLILRDRRVLGEYQPKKGKATDGDVVPNYYPAVVSERQWLAARAGIRERSRHPGRIGEAQINVFARRLFHARDGDAYLMTQRLSRSGGKVLRKFSVLVNAEGEQGRARLYSIEYDVFERAILERLAELDPHEILNGDAPADPAIALASELADVEGELQEAEAFMAANGFSATIGKRVTQLEEKQRELAAALADARQDAAYPLADSWGETQGLVGILDTAPDPREVRLRLRSSLRRIIDKIVVLVVPAPSQTRVIAVQVWFAGGEKHRDYLIVHQVASGRRPATVRVWSLADVVQEDALDLRRQDHARQLEELLQSLDVAALLE